MEQEAKQCPECLQVFRNEHNAWTGIDAHWKSKHDHIMPYNEAWPFIKSGEYARRS